MKIAIVCSNYLSIKKNTKKGTEIFADTLINSLSKEKEELTLTAFASGDSDLPVKIESVDDLPSIRDEHIIKAGKHIIFELALLSKAFSSQDLFDLYHINIGDGDIALPFAPFVKKPILITLHNTQGTGYVDKYFSLFNEYKNVWFVSISNAQRAFFPNLQYAGTVYHGIETDLFKFEPHGGEAIMWSGRGIPEKGLDVLFQLLKSIGRKAKIFVLRKKEHSQWLNKQLEEFEAEIFGNNILIEFDKDRAEIINHYQSSRVFLFPIQWEEPFGLVLIESMACGTPVVAYARGSVAEIVKDGETGFLVNPSDNDTRGDWIVKKTGIEGLHEAVERVYSMKEEEYLKMRDRCRAHVEKYFTAEQMVKNYLSVYKSLVSSFSFLN